MKKKSFFFTRLKYLDLAIVWDSSVTVFRRQRNFPNPVLSTRHGGCFSAPAIWLCALGLLCIRKVRTGGRLTEVSYDICLSCIGCPFPIDDISIRLDNQAKFLITSTELLQTTFGFVDGLDPFLSVTETTSERIFERGKPRVELNNA